MSKRAKQDVAVTAENQPLAERPAEPAVPPPGIPGRIDLVRSWLLAGRSNTDIVQVAQYAFQVSSRMAYYYLARARESLTSEAVREGRSFHLCRSQLLRDRLFERLVRMIDDDRVDPVRLRAVAQAIGAAGRLLGDRDHSTQGLYVALEEGDAEAARERVADCAAALPLEELPALAEDPDTPARLLLAQASISVLARAEAKAGGDACPTSSLALQCNGGRESQIAESPNSKEDQDLELAGPVPADS